MRYVILFAVVGAFAGLALAAVEWGKHGATAGLATAAGALCGAVGLVLARWTWRRIQGDST